MPPLQKLAAMLAVIGISEAVAGPEWVRLNNGVMMPLISLGTGQINDSAVEDIVVAAVTAGFPGVDTAFSYYNQVGVGRALKRLNRSSLFLTTKVSPCQHSSATHRRNITDVEECRQQTIEDIEANFQQLGVDHIDLLLLHGPNQLGAGACSKLANDLNAVQWSVLEYYKTKGKVRAAGLSNFCPSCLAPLMFTSHLTASVNQVKYHVGMTADPEGVMSYSSKIDILPQAYSSLGHGELFTDPVLTRIGTVHSKTASQVALKWIVEKGYPLVVKTTSARHFAEDLDLFSWQLAPEDVKELDTYLTATGDKPSWGCTAVQKLVVI